MRSYINTASTDPSRARTVGLTQLTPEPFPPLIVGTTPSLDWFFASRGVIENYSGNANYTLRVTVGDSWAGPTGGTWSLQIGSETAQTIQWDADAPGLQAVLNNSNTVSAEGGVDVTEQLPGQFLIAHRSIGSVAGLTVDASLLDPDVNSELVVLTAGGGSSRELVQLNLRRALPVQQTTWTPVTSPSNGWTGSIDLTNAASYELIRLNGERRGQFIETESLLSAEVIDASNVSQCSYQTPVLLRAMNYRTPNPAVVPQNFFARPNVTGLASNASDSTKLGGLPTSSSQFPIGSTVQCLFSNDVVGQWIRKSSTANQSVPFVVRPYDYDASNNAYQWIIDRVTKQGQICSWDADTSKWHYQVAEGAANAVSLAVDQTGFSLPA